MLPLSPSAHVDTFTRDGLPPTDQWPDFRFDLVSLNYPQRLNCASELLAGVSGERVCLVTSTTTVTYGALRDLSGRIAQVLIDDAGLVPGNRVLLRAPNNPTLVACWLAVLRAGLVAVTTMPMLQVMELHAVGEIAQVDYCLVDDRFTEAVLAAGLGPCLAFSELIDRAARKSSTFLDCRTAADDVALIAFTSGTTGRPKATMHFHRDVLAIADTFSRHILLPRQDDLFVGSPPLGFTFGLGGLLVFPMRARAATLLLERPTPDVLIPAIAEHRATVLFTAPTAYRIMLQQLDAVPSLRRCVSAGEPLPTDTWHGWRKETNLKIIDGIGTTELLHIFISSADEDIRPGATGRAIPGYEATVLDSDGRPAAAGELGRLAVRGPTGCRYLSDERQTEYCQDGWNLTGDLYVRDSDGYYWYQARSDDLIVSGGFKIAGPEVEMALLRNPDIVECAVVGVPDADRTMTVKAYIVLREGVAATENTVEHMREHCRRLLAAYKVPREVQIVPALPRTSSGKLQRFQLREMSL